MASKESPPARKVAVRKARRRKPSSRRPTASAPNQPAAKKRVAKKPAAKKRAGKISRVATAMLGALRPKPGSAAPPAPESVGSVPRRGPAARTFKPRDREWLSRLAGEVALRKFTAAETRSHQREIHEQTILLSRTIDRPNFTRVGRDDLVRMIRMYDERFFGGKIIPTAEAEGLSFGLSSRMTRVAGKLVTHYPQGDHEGKRKFELILSTTLLFQTFEDVDRAVEVTGKPCRDRLEAMQRVAEHELVHLVEMLIWNDGNCSEARFQSIASRYFGHTDYRHGLITQPERALLRFDIRVGNRVKFSRDGQTLTGRVNRITRRATVLVPDPKGERFSDGHRYRRFYVPLEKLSKVG